MYLKTNALVLREVAYHDTDKLLTILTQDYGRLTVRARGVRSRSSKLKAACQLLAYSEFTLLKRGNYYTVTETELLESFQGLRADLDQLSLGSYLAQLGEALSDTDADSPELLRVLLYALDAISRLKRSQTLVKATTELRLLCLSGFMPSLEGCAVCGQRYPTQFHVGQGVIHCPGCKPQLEDGLSLPLTSGALDAMRYICDAPLDRLYHFDLPSPSCEKLANAAETFLLTQLERGFSALDFYKSLQNVQLESTYESE